MEAAGSRCRRRTGPVPGKRAPRVVGTDAARSTDWQNTLIAGIDAGERFILALTRPAP